MSKTLLLILSSMLVTISLYAGLPAGDELAKPNYEEKTYLLPARHQTKQELTIYQALAVAITQTAVLAETRQERFVAAESPRKKVTIRGRDLTLSYSRNRYEQHCYLAVGPRQKWRTINGQWAARNVNARALKRALVILEANGIKVRDVSISVSTRRDVQEAQRMFHRIGLGDVAVVGHDPHKPNHARISFNTN